MQTFYLSIDEDPIHCTFCGHKVLLEADAEEQISPCKHTLFVATSEGGFEYSSDKLHGLTDLSNDFDFYGYLPDEGVDEFIEQLDLIDSYVVEAGAPAPAGLSVYVGFWPGDE